MTGWPNTRMQRTRSSPSALRSPLMRCPLGGRKPPGRSSATRALGYFLFFGYAVISVAAPTPAKPPSSGSTPTVTSTPTPQLVVRVLDWNGETLPGTRVSVSYLVSGSPRTFACQAGARGIAVIRGLPSGTADVTVSLSAFAEQTLKNVQLHSTGATELSVTLQFASVRTDEGDMVSRVLTDATGNPLRTPPPLPRPTPVPADMAQVQCESR